MSKRVVYKYPLHLGVNKVATFEGSDINLFADQNGQMCVWLQVDLSKPHVERTFEIFGTGHPIPDGYTWWGSGIQGPFVWHLYELEARPND